MYSIWINVYNRDDLQIAMKTAGIWTKKSDGNVMTYSHKTDDLKFAVMIRAHDEALPPTCKVVEEVIEHPAREAYTQVIQKIVCDV